MEIRRLAPGEERAACEFVCRIFDQTAGAALDSTGIEEFHRYANPESLRERLLADHFVIVAAATDTLVGVLELRHLDHIAMLFVDPSAQGRGIGRRLFLEALSECRASPSAIGVLTVHSAPDAAGFYGKMGFKATGQEQLVNGLVFIPMALTYESRRDA